MWKTQPLAESDANREFFSSVKLETVVVGRMKFEKLVVECTVRFCSGWPIAMFVSSTQVHSVIMFESIPGQTLVRLIWKYSFTVAAVCQYPDV